MRRLEDDKFVLVRRTWELMLSMPSAPHGDQMTGVLSAVLYFRQSPSTGPTKSYSMLVCL